jgi:hypothetical protein
MLGHSHLLMRRAPELPGTALYLCRVVVDGRELQNNGSADQLRVKVRVRVPEGRKVKTLSLVRTRETLKWSVRDGWVDVVVPRILIHESLHGEKG